MFTTDEKVISPLSRHTSLYEDLYVFYTTLSADFTLNIFLDEGIVIPSRKSIVQGAPRSQPDIRLQAGGAMDCARFGIRPTDDGSAWVANGIDCEFSSAIDAIICAVDAFGLPDDLMDDLDDLMLDAMEGGDGGWHDE